MRYEFLKCSPTQNMTLLIKSPVPRAEQPHIAARLMDYANVHAEQAGFLEPASMPGALLRLQMMGGEFCGHASMCAAAYLARERGITDGELALEVSGADEPVVCRVLLRGDAYFCELGMPLPARLEYMNGIPIIRLPGIAHAILETDELSAHRDTAPALARQLSNFTGEDAAGVMLFHRARAELVPLVYVRPSDTMVWERGCGSGSAAVGAYLALTTSRSVRLPLTQPGGVITVTAACERNTITSLLIAGEVRIVAEGVAYA